MSADRNSYSQIFRSSSIVGGAYVFNYVIGLIRIKVIAILLGPTGVGLVSLYTSAMGLIGTVSGLGVSNSAVREIVRAYSRHDEEEAARTVRILRRVCWGTGLFGWLLALGLAAPISSLMTGSTDLASSIALLGSTLLFGAIGSGQLALLQGLRRIGDMSLAEVLGTAVSAIVTIALYFWLGKAGILPALIATSLISLCFSYGLSRRVSVAPLAVSWTETLHGFRRLIGLGLAFMWSGVLITGLDMLTRSLITRKFGVDSAGIYQAAWALSGVFASFVLSAMGTDFYPRLTAVIDDKARAVRTVNEQTEIGILLVLPGLLGTLAFAPLIMQIFYTKQFIPAAELLPWMTLGVLGQVVSWPLGFVQLAKGDSRWFAVTETASVGIGAILMFWMLETQGIMGVAYAFATRHALYTLIMLWVSRVLIGFSWSDGVRKLILVSSICIGAALVVRLVMADVAAIVGGGLITLMGSVISLRGLAMRLGPRHRLVKWLCSVPGARTIIGKGMNWI